MKENEEEKLNEEINDGEMVELSEEEENDVEGGRRIEYLKAPTFQIATASLEIPVELDNIQLPAISNITDNITADFSNKNLSFRIEGRTLYIRCPKNKRPKVLNYRIHYTGRNEKEYEKIIAINFS